MFITIAPPPPTLPGRSREQLWNAELGDRASPWAQSVAMAHGGDHSLTGFSCLKDLNSAIEAA